jgi:hypothetical protein
VLQDNRQTLPLRKEKIWRKEKWRQRQKLVRWI